MAAENNGVKGMDRRRKVVAYHAHGPVQELAGRFLRGLDSVRGRFACFRVNAPGLSGELSQAPLTSESGASASSTNAGQSVPCDSGVENPAPRAVAVDTTYAPLRWRLDEEPTADSRFIGLVILAANHRAGSTLLQRICNSRKETLIWGEHNALLRHFAAIYADAAKFSTAARHERENFFQQNENPNLWIASMCPELEYAQRGIIDSARAFLRTFYGQYRENHDLLGFKEVQYGRSELALLRRCYPESQALFLVRNPLNTWKSTPRSWYPSLDVWIERWNSRVACFQEFAANDSNCHLLRYEDLVRQDPKTMEIVGERAKVSFEQIKAILANKIGSTQADLDESDREAIGQRCRRAMEALGYR